MAETEAKTFSSKRLFQVNTRVLLTDLSRELGKKATLSDIPNSFFEFLQGRFDFVYFLGVWQTGPTSRNVALEHPDLQDEFKKQLQDFSPEDVSGSMFAVQDYSLHEDFGGDRSKEGTPDDQLTQLRMRVHEFGLKLILDFVPNHTGLDHAWVRNKPEMYVQASEEQLQNQPQNHFRSQEGRIFAHGKDPFFDGWTDTVQLNYRHPECRAEMTRQLLRIGRYADGLRCDMAMLLLEDVFSKCWANYPLPEGTQDVTSSFWLDAIPAVKQEFPEILFVAEAYWDKEWELQQQGFDYTYDKRLYDRLIQRNPGEIRGHLSADLPFQSRSVRFLENHDEPRAAAVYPDLPHHRAAATLTYLVPGLRFFHDGQFEGRKSKLSVQLNRRTQEDINPDVHGFYHTLLNSVLNRPEVSFGNWKLLSCRPSIDGNPSFENFIVFAWTYVVPTLPQLSGSTSPTECPKSPQSSSPKSPRTKSPKVEHTHISTLNSASATEDLKFLLVVVNYSHLPAQCFVNLMPYGKILFGHKFALHDILSPEVFYVREGYDLAANGLFLDVAAWATHIFEVRLFHSTSA